MYVSHGDKENYELIGREEETSEMNIPGHFFVTHALGLPNADIIGPIGGS